MCRSSRRYPELARASSPNSGSGRSVDRAGRSWIGGAAAALVLALGPAASNEASAATFAADPGAASPHDADGLSGNLIATVPGAAIAGGDHLPSSLEPGHNYDATFVVWVAPNARHATVKVQAVRGVVQYCSAAVLEPGINRHLTCRVRTNAKQRRIPLTVTIVVRVGHLGAYSHTDRHNVAAATPSAH